MPYLNDDEIENLVSRAVSKAIGNGKKQDRQLVSEIVDVSDDDKMISAGGSTGGFAAACASSRSDLIQQQKESARRELAKNPHCIDSAAAEHAFRRTYSAIPASVLDDIIHESGA